MENAEAVTLFENIMNSGFQSTYATINPREDWAEAFALYQAIEVYGFEWYLETNGKIFNLTEHWKELKKKKDFVTEFLNSKYLYPGQK